MKCLILCMCCNIPEYLSLYEDAKWTWASDIVDGKYPDIDLWAYTASTNGEYSLDIEKHIIYVPALDDILHTFDKTVKAIQVLDLFNILYDYLLRTNCSTIINVPLLNNFIHSAYFSSTKIYVAEIFLNSLKCGPTNYMPFIRGNFILMNSYYAHLINYTNLEVLKNCTDYDSRALNGDMFRIDDITLFAIFNMYFIANNINPLEIYLRIPFLYLYNTYLYGNTITDCALGFSIKNPGTTEIIEDYYTSSKEILEDFYEKYYPQLSSDPERLKTMFEQLYYFIGSLFNEETGQNLELLYTYEEIYDIWIKNNCLKLKYRE